jgi:uncharacterized protein
MAKDLKVTVNDLIANKENSLNKTGELHHSEIGLLTVRDIIKELEKPGLDQENQPKFLNLTNVKSIKDVKSGMITES